jgi:hypothetical protein
LRKFSVFKRAGRRGLVATAGAVAASSISASSYRVKFRRAEFLELADIAKPSIIYHRGRMHFFAYDGFVMYTFEC